MIARFMVMLTVPLRRGRLGLHILQALLALGPALHPNIAPVWDHAIPKLAQYLQANSESPDAWNANSWDELVLRLLAETIKVKPRPARTYFLLSKRCWLGSTFRWWTQRSGRFNLVIFTSSTFLSIPATVS